MRGVPSQIIDGLVSRFTESSRLVAVDTERRYTTKAQTLLMTHMFALILRADDWAVDTALVASDLGLDVTKYVSSTNSLQRVS